MRKRIAKLIRTKCSLCYRKDSNDFPCLILKDHHPGIENCVGPFKDHDEHQRIVQEIFGLEKKPEPDIDRAISDALINRYELNKKIIDTEPKERKKKPKTSHQSIAEAQLVLQLSGESTSAASVASDRSIDSSQGGFAGNE